MGLNYKKNRSMKIRLLIFLSFVSLSLYSQKGFIVIDVPIATDVGYVPSIFYTDNPNLSTLKEDIIDSIVKLNLYDSIPSAREQSTIFEAFSEHLKISLNDFIKIDSILFSKRYIYLSYHDTSEFFGYNYIITVLDSNGKIKYSYKIDRWKLEAGDLSGDINFFIQLGASFIKLNLDSKIIESIRRLTFSRLLEISYVISSDEKKKLYDKLSKHPLFLNHKEDIPRSPEAMK